MRGVLKEKKFFPFLGTKAGTVDPDARTLEATISDNSVDRDGEIIQPGAFKDRLATFMKNPVLLWSHNPYVPPIGHATELNIGDDSVEAKFQFRPKGDDPLTDNVFSAYKSGALSSFSIGFRVFDIDEPKFDDEGKQTTPPIITDAELFEVSAVTIPANVNAVAKSAGEYHVLKGGLEAYCKATGQAIPGMQTVVSTPERTLYVTPTPLDTLTKAAELVRDYMGELRNPGQVSADLVRALRTLRASFVGMADLVEDEPEVAELAGSALESLNEFLSRAGNG